MTRLATLAAVAAILLLSGCSATGEGASSSASPSEAPSASPAPSDTPVPETQVPETHAPVGEDGFTDDILIQACLESTAGDFGTPLQPDLASASVEHNDSEHPWFVLVPGLSGGSQSFAYCTIGGTAADPTFELRGAADASVEDEVRSWVD